MASTRLPGKVAGADRRALAARRTALRASASARAAPVMLATTTNAGGRCLVAIGRGATACRSSADRATTCCSRFVLAARSVGAQLRRSRDRRQPGGRHRRCRARARGTCARPAPTTSIEDGLPYGAASKAMTVDALEPRGDSRHRRRRSRARDDADPARSRRGSVPLSIPAPGSGAASRCAGDRRYRTTIWRSCGRSRRAWTTGRASPSCAQILDAADRLRGASRGARDRRPMPYAQRQNVGSNTRPWSACRRRLRVVLLAQVLEGAPARALWQPTAALVVFGGTLAAVSRQLSVGARPAHGAGAVKRRVLSRTRSRSTPCSQRHPAATRRSSRRKGSSRSSRNRSDAGSVSEGRAGAGRRRHATRRSRGRFSKSKATRAASTPKRRPRCSKPRPAMRRRSAFSARCSG